MRCRDCVDPGRCSPSRRSRSARRGEAEHRASPTFRCPLRSGEQHQASAPLRWPLPLASSMERGAGALGERAARTHRTVLSKPRVSALPPAARPPLIVAGTCLRNVTYLHTFPDNVRLPISYRQIARPVHGAVYFTGSSNSSYIFCSEVYSSKIHVVIKHTLMECVVKMHSLDCSVLPFLCVL